MSTHPSIRTLLLAGVATALLPGLAGVTTSAFASAATSSTGRTSPIAWSLAKVHVSIRSSSDWSTVVLGGVVIAARRGVASGATVVSPLSNGWSLSGAGTYQLDTVLAATPADLKVTVQKGNIGSTSVTITRAGRTAPLLGLSDLLVGSSSNPWNTDMGSIARSALSSAVLRPTDLPRGDSRKLTLAFAYPWFTAYQNAGIADKPADARSWDSDAGVLSMTQQAKGHGISGFVLSDAGEQNSGTYLDRTLAAANATGSVVTPYLETAMAVSDAGTLQTDPVGLVERWLRSALLRSSDPAFLKTGGKPVVFVYDMSRLTVDQWSGMRSRLAADDLAVDLIGDATAPAYAACEGGQHAYSAVDDIPTLAKRSQWLSVVQRAQSVLDGSSPPPITVATVSPGYNDTALRGGANPVVSLDGGRRYADTWAAALSGTPDWVVVTSWNEWFEGTSIEPGVVAGGLALDQTAQQSAYWRSAR